MNTIKIFIFVLSTLFSCTKSFAGPFTDSLSKCIVLKTTDNERTMITKWTFLLMSKHPDIRVMSNISKSQEKIINYNTSSIMTSLLLDRCNEEAIHAFRYEGTNAFEVSFGVLGEISMQNLMLNKDVIDFIEKFEHELKN